jgi:hypothetical protein
MRAPDAEAVSRLLTETEDAHGVYETGELAGVYDENWAAWYARYLVDHGIEAMLGRALTVDQLTRLLADNFDQYRTEDPAAGATWADWTARRLVDTAVGA